MGKKPVVGLVGLVWAGIALTGCGECCRNTRNTYNPRPQWQMKEGAAPKAPVNDGKGVSMDVPPAKPPEAGGPMPISEGPPAAGRPAPAPMGSVAAPTAREALRSPALEDEPRQLPSDQPVDFRKRETGAGADMAGEPVKKLTTPALPVVGERKVNDLPDPVISTPSSMTPRREDRQPKADAAPTPPGPIDPPSLPGAPPAPNGPSGS